MPARRIALALAAGVLALAGCTAGLPVNPSFPLSAQAAGDELADMRAHPLPPVRPVVVIGGVLDFGPAVGELSGRLKSTLPPGAPVLTVAIGLTPTMDASADRVVRRVDAAFASGDPVWTAEVDVVGFSLGGVVARYAASERPDGGRRLRIARLFTLASPHRGAPAAALPTIDSRIMDIRPGSDFLGRLDAALAADPYEVVAYVRLEDGIVGAENAGVGDAPAYWVPNVPLTLPHLNAHQDPRILADIARRLRGEPGYTVGPPAPLPGPGGRAAAGNVADRPPDWLLVFP